MVFIAIKEREDDKGGRKRKRRSEGVTKTDNAPRVQQPGPLPPAAENASLEFCFSVDPRGTVIRVFSFYTLAFAVNSIFFCLY